MLRFLHIILLVSLLSFSASPSDLRDRLYDFQFKRATSKYWIGQDWRLLKSQCWQESRFITDAVSPVGARGLCQFMPGTWSEVSRVLGWTQIDPFDPMASIEAAAFYDARMFKIWSSPRPNGDRVNLSLACYNAGCGHLLKAQRVCPGSILYHEIIACLPAVTGRHSLETINYVRFINKYHRQLILGGF